MEEVKGKGNNKRYEQSLSVDCWIFSVANGLMVLANNNHFMGITAYRYVLIGTYCAVVLTCLAFGAIVLFKLQKHKKRVRYNIFAVLFIVIALAYTLLFIPHFKAFAQGTKVYTTSDYMLGGRRSVYRIRFVDDNNNYRVLPVTKQQFNDIKYGNPVSVEDGKKATVVKDGTILYHHDSDIVIEYYDNIGAVADVHKLP